MTAEPGEDARATTIPNTCQAVVDVLGGYPARLTLCPGIMAFVHDEGLVLGLPWNRQVGPTAYLAGPILVVGESVHGGGWARERSLTDDEEALILRFLNAGAPRLDPRPSSIEELQRLIGPRHLEESPLDRLLRRPA